VLSAGRRSGHSRIVAYVVLAYALSWAWWIPLAISGATIGAGQGWPTHLVGLGGPALAALIVTGVGDGRRGLRELGSRIVRWRVRPIWYGTVAVMVVVAMTTPVTASDVGPADIVRYSGAPTVGVAVVPYVLLVNGFGEEIGWRGLLAERLLRTTSPGATALVVWPIWALWHLPLFWLVESFRDFGVAGTVGWAVGIGFGSVVLTWLYDSANRSILLVALWHTAYNFATATDAAGGIAAALATAAVIVAGVVILRRPATWAVRPPAGTDR
jgi:membrane protease YdiL (CAAX protease family)